MFAFSDARCETTSRWAAFACFNNTAWRFVSFRLDVRDFLLPQEVLGRGRITNNVTVLGGFSAWVL